jgi:shikimate kinase
LTARLALIGAPGAGKSTVAADLAQRWGCPYVDTDERYATEQDRTVAEAVIDDEAAFRAIEERIVLDALDESGAVVAVGSGALASQKVRDALVTVRVVWLELGLVDAARRTGLSAARPLSLGNVRGQLHDMLRQRAAVYASVADHTVHTDGRQPTEVADEIENWETS